MTSQHRGNKSRKTLPRGSESGTRVAGAKHTYRHDAQAARVAKLRRDQRDSQAAFVCSAARSILSAVARVASSNGVPIAALDARCA